MSSVLYNKQLTAWSVLKEYFDTTSIHGVRYVMKNDSTLLERVCWIIAVLVCSTYSCLLVRSAWYKYQNSPTVITVENTHYPLYYIDFPAITVCPANRVKKDVAEKWIARYFNLTYLNDTMKGHAWRVMSVVGTMQFPFFGRMAQHLQALQDSKLMHYFGESFSVLEFAIQTMPTCKDVFYACYWEGQHVNCCHVFQLQRSEAGYCYSFNSLTSEVRKDCKIADTGEVLSVSDVCTLWRNTGNGAGTGLELFLLPTTETVRLGPGQRDRNGYRILLHDPLSFPESAQGQYVREYKMDTFTIRITPTMTSSNSDVKRLPISERMCYFPNEGQLDIFTKYSQKNCYIQCRMDYIMSECGCQTYHFAFRNVSQCTLEQYQCLATLDVKLRSISAPKGITGMKFTHKVNCSHCLPTCHETVYNLDTTTSKDGVSDTTEADCYIDIYYKEPGFIKYKRSISFGTDDLLVSFGGVMGLFLGVSFLSGVELLVYIVKLLKVVIIQHSYMRDKEETKPVKENNNYKYSPTFANRRNSALKKTMPQYVWYY